MNETRSLVNALAEVAVEVRDRGVPPEVASSVQQRILDVLGICVAASALPTSAAMRNFVRSQGGAQEAVSIGVPGALPAAWSALLNGTLAHSLDYDDTHLPSVVHPSASVIPACLAAAQLVGSTGHDTISAAAVGLEICVRLGLAGYDEASRNSLYFDRGQHATSMCGGIGAAAAVASLLGLDAKGVADAMAVAVSMASGVIEANRTGGTVKRIHCGWAAHAALCAGRLAQFGITGPATVLEGRFGFFRAFLDGRYNAAAITSGFGSDWCVPGINFKPYPANHFCHAGIDAALALRGRGLRPEMLESLTLGVAGPAMHTVGEPIDTKRSPETGYQAQFSGPYTVVAGLLGGHGLGLGLDDFTDKLACDAQRREMMQKVTVVEDPEATAVFPRQFAAVVTATTKDGKTLCERVMTNRGGAARPLSDHELRLKFADNTKRALRDHERDLVLSAVAALRVAPNVDACMSPLSRELSP